MKIYNWSDFIIQSLLGITVIAVRLHDFRGLIDIPFILFGVYSIIQGIRYGLSKERYDLRREAAEVANTRQKRILSKYGKKIRILQNAPSVILLLAVIIMWIFKDQDWTVMTLFIAIALFLILLLIKSIIEYPFSD